MVLAEIEVIRHKNFVRRVDLVNKTVTLGYYEGKGGMAITPATCVAHLRYVAITAATQRVTRSSSSGLGFCW